MERITRSWAALMLCALLMATLVGAASARPKPAPLASPAKTLTVSAADCYPVRDYIQYLNGGWFLEGSVGTVSFVCPAHFPDGGTYEILVQSITMYAFDNESGRVCLEAARTRPDDGDEDIMVDDVCTTNSTADPQTRSTSSIAHKFVDPTQGMYLWVTMASNGQRLYGFHISYDIAASIDIEKSTNGHDADTPPGALVPVPGTVTWSYKVTNTGGVALTNVQVTDNRIVGDICTISSLAAGASDTCTAMGGALEGQYDNIGTVTAEYNGTTVSDTDPSHYWGTAGPILSTYFPLIMRNY